MPKWLCDTCNFMVETQGTTPPPSEGLKPTPWDLPADWTCQICGSPREALSPVDPADYQKGGACNRWQ
jgi:rubredoxin